MVREECVERGDGICVECLLARLLPQVDASLSTPSKQEDAVDPVTPYEFNN